MSKVAIVLLTYNRLEYATQTLVEAFNHIRTSQHNLVWHIASDGDSPEYIQKLIEAHQNVAGDAPLSVSNSKRGGYGKNFNLAMQALHADCEFVIPIEDDWELIRELDIDPMLEDMEGLHFGCVRLGYIGYTQELRGVMRHGKCGHWLQFDPRSAEPHVFAGHPRIEARWWSRGVKPWPEGINPGETEFAVAHRPEARQYVAWPLDVIRPFGDMFVHIGTRRSY